MAARDLSTNAVDGARGRDALLVDADVVDRGDGNGWRGNRLGD